MRLAHVAAENAGDGRTRHAGTLRDLVNGYRHEQRLTQTTDRPSATEKTRRALDPSLETANRSHHLSCVGQAANDRQTPCKTRPPPPPQTRLAAGGSLTPGRICHRCHVKQNRHISSSIWNAISQKISADISANSAEISRVKGLYHDVGRSRREPSDYAEILSRICRQNATGAISRCRDVPAFST